MEAVLYEALGKSGIQQIESPPLQATEVLVQTRASGVCHTDIDVLYGRYGNSTFPLVPGHEYAGVVTEIGSDVKHVNVGDRVVVDPNFSCGHCPACQKGLSNLCETLGAYGVTKNGGFAEFSAVDAGNVIPIGDMDFSLAALAEPMGCVLNGVGAIGTEGVKSALIFGAGPIGLLMAIALRTRGIGDITLADLDQSRLELAESMGFIPVASGSEALAQYRQSTDLVVDATGVASVAESLINYAANGGKVLFFGVCAPDAKIAVSPFEVFRRQITLAGAHSLNHNLPEALAAIRGFGDTIRQVISHQVPLAEIPDFLGKNKPQKTLKVQAVW
ncbi:MAG: zinc-dependent alcohol dehydrogenase family protein [Thiolinea sp.]